MCRPGCHEHFLWHQALHGHPDGIDELALVASIEDEPVGCIMSTRARIVQHSGGTVEVLALGPVGIDPAHQRRGIGSRLIQETLARACTAGYRGAFLYGDPTYDPRFGFRDAAQWGITTAEGHSFPAFMAIELRDDGLTCASGRLIESPLFEVDDAQVDEFDAHFPTRAKKRTSTQL